MAVLDADPAGHAVAVGELGALPFPVTAQLLEEVEAKAVAAWTKAVRGVEADYVVIDAPGALGAAFGAVVAIVDLALIPVGASMLDIRGAAETVGIVRRHRKAGGRGRPDILVVPSRVDRRTGSGRVSSEPSPALPNRWRLQSRSRPSLPMRCPPASQCHPSRRLVWNCAALAGRCARPPGEPVMASKPRNRAGMDAEAVARMMALQDQEDQEVPAEIVPPVSPPPAQAEVAPPPVSVAAATPAVHPQLSRQHRSKHGTQARSTAGRYAGRPRAIRH